MRTKIALAGLIGLSLLLLTGCDLSPTWKWNFVGVRVRRGAKIDEALISVTRDESGKGIYNYRKDLVDWSVTCYAITSPSRITFEIHNDSKRPIRMNYFADSYNLRTRDGKIFILEIASKISGYPEYPSLINPDQSETVHVFYPSGVKETEIDLMAIELDYGEVVIGLRRIEEPG